MYPVGPVGPRSNPGLTFVAGNEFGLARLSPGSVAFCFGVAPWPRAPIGRAFCAFRSSPVRSHCTRRRPTPRRSALTTSYIEITKDELENIALDSTRTIEIDGSGATRNSPSVAVGLVGSELAIIGRSPHTCRDCIKGTVEGGTGYKRADWSTQGRPKCHRAITSQAQPKQANRFQYDRTTLAVRQTKLLMDWTQRPRHYGTPPKICLLGSRPMMSKKSRYLTGLIKHRKFSGRPAVRPF